MHCHIIAFVIFLYVPSVTAGQEFLLLRPTSIHPVKVSNTITQKDIKDQRFPIEMKDIDSVLIILNELKNHIQITKEIKIGSQFSMSVGKLQIQANAVRKAYGTRFNIFMENTIDGSKYAKYLGNSGKSNTENIKQIDKLIEQLKTHKR